MRRGKDSPCVLSAQVAVQNPQFMQAQRSGRRGRRSRDAAPDQRATPSFVSFRELVLEVIVDLGLGQLLEPAVAPHRHHPLGDFAAGRHPAASAISGMVLGPSARAAAMRLVHEPFRRAEPRPGPRGSSAVHAVTSAARASIIAVTWALVYPSTFDRRRRADRGTGAAALAQLGPHFGDLPCRRARPSRWFPS